ncbi:MAG: tetratricopeptide repeat protein [Bacteroidales bacterium]
MNGFITLILIAVLSINTKAQTLFDSVTCPECQELYNSQMLKEARDCFLKYDTSRIAIYNAAIISLNLEDTLSARKLAKQLMKGKYSMAEGYCLYASTFDTKSKEYTDVINKGLAKFEDNETLYGYKVNYYIATENYHEAINAIDKQIEISKDDNASSYFLRGTLYGKMGDIDNSLRNYELALKIDPNHFQSNCDLGAYFYNKGVEKDQELIKIQLDDIEHYEELKHDAEIEYRKAITFFVKANETQPQEIIILEILRNLYHRLSDFDKYNQITKSIEELENGK